MEQKYQDCSYKVEMHYINDLSCWLIVYMFCTSEQFPLQKWAKEKSFLPFGIQTPQI